MALLDSGNLVLRSVSNSSALIWESFDHPTHTSLPGGKLGMNKRTSKSQLLTSWKNSNDPATGLFFLELDPAGTNQSFILWNDSEKYWSSGTWDGWDGHIFSLEPEMTRNCIYDFTYVTNKDENYFTYSVKNSSIISRLFLDVSAEIKQVTWLDGIGWNLFWTKPSQQCDVYALCGAFGTCNQQASTFCGCLRGFNPRYATDYSNLSDWSGGCFVNNASVNGEKDGFFNMSNVRLPINLQFLAVESILACELACLNNCSCRDLLNLAQLSDSVTSGGTLYLELAASELSISISGGKKSVGAVSGAVVLFGLLVVLLWARQKRNSVGRSKAIEGSLIPFSYRDLQIATKNFSDKLGGGGFGSVFKGVLPNSTVVAVKKLEGINQGEKQFRTEVSTIGTIQHVNLVRLLGFCSEGTKRLLVYEFMPTGSLDSYLFHETRDSEVLAYLYVKCRQCIIHCDIKPENILLDAEFCPKVADFGLAKLVGREFSRVLTTMRGTRGYLAPEWISGVAITAKADVYSYGMMLFELISGKRNSDQSDDGEKVGGDGEILTLLDYRLEGNGDLAELTRACKVASWCVQDEKVPSMGLVVQILEEIVEVIPPPVPRTLQALAENHEHIVFFTESSSDQSSQS
ncbi:hypothetical protein NE237_000566 [Protea cynaroides]|uniref:Protein kinase domain-containing protein n=1 Tax=Protea cynaroides TaxID=273540 RepID=A0A9Q0QX95_9MAGN|nr:hypothetical protein NE237_000566 [Protea cynaroides]